MSKYNTHKEILYGAFFRYGRLAFVFAVAYFFLTTHAELSKLRVAKEDLLKRLTEQQELVEDFANAESQNWQVLLAWSQKVRGTFEDHDQRLEKLEKGQTK